MKPLTIQHGPTFKLGHLVAALSALFLTLSQQVQGAGSTFTWDGGGANDLWSTGGNWGGLGPSDPQNKLQFGGSTRLTNTNDFSAGSSGWQIFFLSGAGAFNLWGNSITFFDFGGGNPKIENSSTTLQTVSFNITEGNAFPLEINPVQGDLLINSPSVVLNGSGQLRVFGINGGSPGGTVTFSSGTTISGGPASAFASPAVAIMNNAMVIYSNANTYAGDTWITNGTLRLAAANATTSTGRIRMGSSAASTAATLLLDNSLSCVSAINPHNPAGSGTLTIGNSSFGSGVATFSGDLFLDRDLTVASDPAGSVTLSGTTLDLKSQTLTVTGSGNTTISTSLTNTTGSGKLIKSGAGTLSLNAANTNSGTITITAGTISLGHIAGLGHTSAATIVTNSGILDLNGKVVGVEPLTLGGGTLTNGNATAASLGGAVTLTANSTIGAGVGNITLTGVIGGTGFGFTKNGAATLTLGPASAANTYTGAVTNNAGTLSLANSSSGRTQIPGNLTINGGTVLENSTSELIADASTVFITGGTWQLGASGSSRSETINTLVLDSGTFQSDNSSSTLAISGGTIDARSGSLGGTVNGGKIDSPSLTKSTAGTVTFTARGSATSSGLTATTNNAGTLVLDYSLQDSSKLANTGTLVVNSGELDFKGGSHAEVVGTMILTGGVITNVSGTASLSMASPTIFDVRAGSDFTVLAGTASLTKSTAGTVILGGANSYSGGTLISAGILQVGNGAAAGTSGSAAAAITNNAALVFNRSDAAYSISGVISGGGTITNAGTGTVTLSGANTYTGKTVVQTGAIKISNASALGASGAGQETTVNSGAQLQTSGALTFPEPLTLNGTGLASDGALLVTANGPTFTGAFTLGSTSVRINNNGAGAGIGGGITGSGIDLAFGGTAGWTVSNAPINIGTATLTKDGGTGGILRLNTANTIGAVSLVAGGLNVGDAGCFGASTITAGSGVGTPIDTGGILAGGTLGLLNVPNNVVLNSGAICGLAPAGSTTLNLAGNISGAGAMRRTRLAGTGAGNIMLSGANTFGGGLTHATDVLILSNKLALGTGTYTIGDTTFPAGSAPDISASTALTGANSVTNPVTINTNAFFWTGANDLEFSGTVTLLKSPTITVSNTAASILSGAISGSGLGITKAGPGTLAQNGNSTYNGATTVTGTGSKLLVNGSISNSAVTVQTNATLGGTGAVASITVNLGGTLAPGASVGTLTVLASPSLSGSNAMEINVTSSTPSSDKLVVAGNPITYGGSLNVTLLGTSDPLTGGETFDLFVATGFSGAFTATNLPSLAPGLNWWTDKLYVDGSITVNRPPTAQDQVYGRAKGISLKIAKAGLMVGASDPDAGDSASYDALAGTGSQGATVTEDATYVFYSPVNDNPDTLQYRVKDTRGGTVTKNISIAVTNAVGSAQSITVSGNTATVTFAGIPGFSYEVQRSTNLVDWATILTTNAPPTGVFQHADDFNDLGVPPDPAPASAYYRLRQP